MVLSRFKLTRKNFGVVVAYVAAFSSLVASLAFAYALLHPVDVLQDWSITSQNKVYHPGDEVTFNSSVTKTMNVTGKSTRYIVCTVKGVETRYELNNAIADRPTGTRMSTITVVLPPTITSLPQTCHLNIHIDYSIYGFRSFVETVDSNDFQVVK